MEKINWYPGHMKKTREMIQENLKLVDLIIELLDARIPVSSRNPVIGDLTGGKPRIILLNKKDLADPGETSKWGDAFRKEGIAAIPTDSESGDGIKKLLAKLQDAASEIRGSKKWDKPLRLMIVGIPNVGKSSLINRLTGRKAAKTGDKPGVTKGKQWLTLENGMQLLDTPGILWPNIDDPESGRHLAFCGAIKDEIYDISDLALEFIRHMMDTNKVALEGRYGINVDEILEEQDEDGYMPSEPALAVMESIALKRGFILPGKRIDYERTSRTLLDEFREGKMGRITIESVKA